ncbi:MAG: acyl-CoA dehydrogenase family protein [Gammaproteobacteria bacterium]|nr:acyl-CoA dehydrogenase family protein [Gammaproteobacteria bacterium]
MAAPNHIQAAESLAPLIRGHADEAERIRHLPQPVAKAFARHGLYRLAGTNDIHGADADPMTQIAVIEAASRADGSAGWNLMIGIETFGLIGPGFKGRCPELIVDPMTIMASSTAAVHPAQREGDGWRVSGQWQFASGIHNAQIFGATVRLYDGGELLDEGNRYAVVPVGEFEIIDTWHVAGLRGSGSHDVRLDDVYVPDSRIIAPIGGNEATTPQLRLPLGNRLAYNKAAVAIGIARAGIDAFVELATSKQPRFTTRTVRDRPFAQRAIALAEARLTGARAALMDLTEASWETVVRGHEVSPRDRALFHIVASDTARAAVETVDILCEAAGTSANRIGDPLERISRDVRVVRQHATVAPHLMEDAGRTLLGLESESFVVRSR